MKNALGWIIAFYVGLAVLDYVTARQHVTREFCATWMKAPVWMHLILPGSGNACIDKGLWP